METHAVTEAPKRAFFANRWSGNTAARAEAESLLGELISLGTTLGLDIAGREIVHIRETNARYGIGTGQAQALAEKAAEAQADCLVFDWDISPAQQRNWETLCDISTLDRRELIIQIFADRARTREASLQVELARLKYALPRLSHKYIDLARQRGGRYGTKGSGETKLENDRRLVRQRIQKLETEITAVYGQRAVQRKQREKRQVRVCALVGYTNAGKSSLLNALTGADAFVEDELFATLDPTSRKLSVPSGRPTLLVDTVGFIRRLPHDLVDAFRATLEEAARADLLIQVIDAADPGAEYQYQATMTVLRELGAENVPRLVVLNKIDRIDVGQPLAPEAADPRLLFPDAISVSAKTRAGLEALIRQIDARLP